MNVPKLRFKEFNDEIKEYEISDILEIKNGLNKEKEEFGFGTPIINYMDVNKKELIFSKNIKGLVNASQRELESFKVKKGDIFFTRTSETSDEIGLSASVMDDIDNCVYSGFILKASQKENILNPVFSGYYFRNPRMRNEIIKHSSITTRALTSGTLLGQMKVFIPSYQEQDKIGKTLYLLDKKIELQLKKIEDLKLFKLSQLNLIKVDNFYKKISLKDILKECNEKTTINNQYEILSSTAKGIFLQSEYFNKQAASENNIGYKILKQNQLVLSPQNLWMGNININNKYKIGIVSPSYKIFDINTNLINIEYFKNWIKSPRALYEYMISSEQGASIVRRNLNMNLFNEITLSVPNMVEQNKIGNMLSLIDNKIILEEYKYNKFIELKKGLMQSMFV